MQTILAILCLLAIAGGLAYWPCVVVALIMASLEEINQPRARRKAPSPSGPLSAGCFDNAAESAFVSCGGIPLATPAASGQNNIMTPSHAFYFGFWFYFTPTGRGAGGGS